MDQSKCGLFPFPSGLGDLKEIFEYQNKGHPINNSGSDTLSPVKNDQFIFLSLYPLYNICGVRRICQYLSVADIVVLYPSSLLELMDPHSRYY